MKKGLIVCALIICLAVPCYVFAGVPLATVQGHVDNVLDVLRDPALQADSAKEAKKEKIRTISNDMFNWAELSKRALGKNWRKLDNAQRTEFIDLFKIILEKAYINRILAYKDEKVVFHKEKMISDKKAEVRSNILQRNIEIPINYRLILKNGRWGVYDVIVEGVSLVKNYRTQFRDILANKSPEQMLEILRKKAGKA